MAGKTVVDIGTGSGLLAIAALQLGLKDSRGVDSRRSRIARRTGELRVRSPLRNLAVGSAHCLEADVTIANISATVILSIADELLRIGGQLILTGFSDYEFPAMQQMFGAGAVTSSGEWRCLSLQAS